MDWLDGCVPLLGVEARFLGHPIKLVLQRALRVR